MNDVQVRAFLAAAECGSFTSAAAKLYLPHQAVSKYVRNLENELQVQLFRRGDGTLALTEAGRAYLALFAETASRIRGTREETAAYYHVLTHTLRVGVSSWVDVFGLIGDCLLAYRDAHPDVQLIVRVYDNPLLRQELEQGNLDAIVVCGDRYIESTQLSHVSIASENMCMYAPDWVEGDRIDPACWGLPLLQRTSWDWSYLEWKYIGTVALQQFDFTPGSILLLPNTETLLSRMRLGDCIAIADNNFSVLRNMPGTRQFPLCLSSHLECIWMTANESPLLPGFVEHLQTNLSAIFDAASI